jgi:hypothetical protein
MAEPITKLEDLPANVRRVIEANAGNELIPVKRDASGVITEYRQMSPQEYLTSKGGVTRAGYFGNDIGMSDEEYFGLLKKGGVELLNATKEARVREGETQKLISRYMSQGLSQADAAAKAAEFFTNAEAALRQGYEIDEEGNYVPLGTSGGGSFAGLSGPRSSGFGSGTATDSQRAERQSAYDLLYAQFKQYGLEALVEPLKGLIVSGASPAEFTIKLRDTDAYKKRFAANAQRIQKGLTAISEAEYLGLEDQYQNIMRNYGLPEQYYKRGDMGTQEGFNQFIANDVSAAELEDRIMTAQNRVMNANPEVIASLKAFYPDINNGDILAYTLDPTKGLDSIKRKVTAAEIGGGAMQAGLGISGARAEELTAAGITKQQAQQGFGTIAGGLQRGSQLASIYGENPYTQTTAEKEVFGLAGKTEAEKERKKLTGLEKATFSGQTGLTTGALARDRAGTY